MQEKSIRIMKGGTIIAGGFFALIGSLLMERGVSEEARGYTCGVGAYLDITTNTCSCEPELAYNPDKDPIIIAGIFDMVNFGWGEDIFNATIDFIKEGDFDESLGFELSYMVQKSGIEFSVTDSACDESDAAGAYWEARTGGKAIQNRLHGVVGARCSGASSSIARIAGLEGIPQISPCSTSSRLSDTDRFPLFSRLVAPDNMNGEVGALLEILRGFGWDRISILSTDNPFASDLSNEFRKHWKGDLFYSGTIRVEGGTLDIESVEKALNGVPTDDPKTNSRVILLSAQNQHAYQILKKASEMNFQPDTIWVGPSAWTGSREIKESLNFLPTQPGYIGVGVRRSDRDAYTNFLKKYNKKQKDSDKKEEQELPIFAAEMVDSIIALVAAIAYVPIDERRNGALINSNIVKLEFEGVSGSVAFTEKGDRKDPQYSILHLANNQVRNGTPDWSVVGSTGIQVGSSTFDLWKICFAQRKCGLSEVPLDRYPVPPVALPVWALVCIVVFIVLFVLVAGKYWRSRKSKHTIKAELEAFRDSFVGMRTAEKIYLPSMFGAARKNLVIQPTSKAQWCWQEIDSRMNCHAVKDVVGDPAKIWIKYDEACNSALEASFQEQGGWGSFSPMPDYVVKFESMVQKKISTGFERNVKRQYDGSAEGHAKSMEVDFSKSYNGGTLPEDIAKEHEPQVVLAEGDIIQISKQRPDGWAFGTKLYHADEVAVRKLVSSLSNNDDANILTDTGWFMMDATRVPTAKDLAVLEKNVGDTGALAAPSNWATIVDPSIVEQHALPKHDLEREEVIRAFMSTMTNKKVDILQVERIQNLAMWQSYVVKRQTICYRESKLADTGSDSQQTVQKNALQRFEKRWLWHGTNVEVMDKILQQGFNRSFCGKNATLYGKGVYFARDASYSSSNTYAVPDSGHNQYIMACRVVVGEYCRGEQNAVTPSIRDKKNNSLYDSTVDTMVNSSIYVTYHDAQAYPEYLIKFKNRRGR